MKKIVLILLTLITAAAHSSEIYSSGDFWAPCNSPGKNCRFNLQLSLDLSDSQISGKVINMYGVAACRWEDVPVNGTITPQGDVRWRSEKNPVAGCGSLVFQGKKEGDHFVGVFPKFQGKSIELTLTKKAH